MNVTKILFIFAGIMAALPQSGYTMKRQKINEDGERFIPLSPHTLDTREEDQQGLSSSASETEISPRKLSALITQAEHSVASLPKKQTILHALGALLDESATSAQANFLAESDYLSDLQKSELALFALRSYKARQLSQRSFELSSKYLEWLQTTRQAIQTNTAPLLCFNQFHELLAQENQLNLDISIFSTQPLP